MNITTFSAEALTKKIEASLDSIRPYLIADGGNIKVLDITEDMVVKLEFVGACGDCPMSTMTFKAGIEEAIKRGVPEIKSVVVVNLTALGHHKN